MERLTDMFVFQRAVEITRRIQIMRLQFIEALWEMMGILLITGERLAQVVQTLLAEREIVPIPRPVLAFFRVQIAKHQEDQQDADHAQQATPAPQHGQRSAALALLP